MHEFGMVDEFIDKLLEAFASPEQKPGEVIRVGFGPGLLEDSLRQAFQVHTKGTLLSNVHFEFIRKNTVIPCSCGAVLNDKTGDADLPYVVCEECQHVSAIPDFNVLEFIDAY